MTVLELMQGNIGGKVKLSIASVRKRTSYVAIVEVGYVVSASSYSLHGDPDHDSMMYKETTVTVRPANRAVSGTAASGQAHGDL